jgi:hypothetical protein
MAVSFFRGLHVIYIIWGFGMLIPIIQTLCDTENSIKSISNTTDITIIKNLESTLVLNCVVYIISIIIITVIFFTVK